MSSPSSDHDTDPISSSSPPPLLLTNSINFHQIHLGPTDSSNWLIPNRILMSAYPGDINLEKSKLKIKQLLSNGINCFICLQLKEELTRFIPYQPLIEEYCKLNQEEFDTESKRKIEFLNLPIPDTSITKDDLILTFIHNELIPRVRNPNVKCLLHCWGGHGRTGTVSALLLSHLYQMGAEEALERVALVHSCREVRKSRAPQTASQFDQVRRLAWKEEEEQEE